LRCKFKKSQNFATFDQKLLLLKNQPLSLQKPKKFDLSGFLRLVRINNLLILAFSQWMIKAFLIDDSLDILLNLRVFPLFGLMGSTVLIAAAGYVINDYYDVKIDTVNKPQEVIVGRLIKRRVAMFLNFAFNLLGLGLAWTLGWWIFGTCLLVAFMLWWYSNQLKRLPLIGNLMIAALTAMAVLLLAIYYTQNRALVYLFALFAFFISLIREIVKDMEDVKGDAVFGCRTLPIVWGISRTKRVIYVFFGIFVVILLSTYLTFPSRFAMYLYGVVLPPLAWFVYQLYYADSKKDFRALSTLCKLIMVLGVLSMVLI
jgi:4-hydroxybenzoate polyprenyltransferase